MTQEEARQERLRAALSEAGGAALIVSTPANVRYLTGYTGTNGLAVVPAEGTGRLLTDSRYAVSARAQVRGLEVVVGSRDLLGDVAGAVRELVPEGAVGVEAEHLTLARHERLVAALDGRALTPTRALVEDLRVVKDDGEIALVREAARMADTALAAVLAGGLAGRTEREVAFALHAALLDAGAEGPSFPVIVAGGANGARPHAVPGEASIASGTLVVIDQGAVHGGYCSDMTRTYATGPLPDELARAYAVCAEAQAAALAAVRPGVAAGDVDAVARDVIAAAGLGEAFRHGLGHGVGIEIHERPTLRPGGAEVLRSGMVVTVEPGVYLEGVGGVRIEDLVLVTGDGGEALSHTPKGLLTVGEPA